MQVHIWIGCISISAVTATYGFAFTASHLEARNAARPVGASLLAMNLRAPWGVWCPASSLTSIASMLAPTGPAAMGHPWPSAAKPASMPVYPLRRTGTKPLDGARKSKAKATRGGLTADLITGLSAIPLWERAGSGRRSDDGRPDNATIQTARVIVDVHREQARSHRELGGICKVRSAVRPPRFGFRFGRPVKPRWPNAGIA